MAVFKLVAPFAIQVLAPVRPSHFDWNTQLMQNISFDAPISLDVILEYRALVRLTVNRSSVQMNDRLDVQALETALLKRPSWSRNDWPPHARKESQQMLLAGLTKLKLYLDLHAVFRDASSAELKEAFLRRYEEAHAEDRDGKRERLAVFFVRTFIDRAGDPYWEHRTISDGTLPKGVEVESPLPNKLPELDLFLHTAVRIDLQAKIEALV